MAVDGQSLYGAQRRAGGGGGQNWAFGGGVGWGGGQEAADVDGHEVDELDAGEQGHSNLDSASQYHCLSSPSRAVLSAPPQKKSWRTPVRLGERLLRAG